MIYSIRKVLNKLLRGRLLKLTAYFKDVQTDVLYGQPFGYYLKSDIGYNLFNKGEFEKKELKLCEQFIRKDSNIIDIGANIGIHSVYFAQIAKSGNVIAVEPQTHIYQVLIENLKQGVKNYIYKYNFKRFHSSLNYKKPMNVYLEHIKNVA